MKEEIEMKKHQRFMSATLVRKIRRFNSFYAQREEKRRGFEENMRKLQRV